jgi:AcrR family transcriptional regulator
LLAHRRGAAATRLDDVMAATGTSKSQLYHYFAGKDALIREVVNIRVARHRVIAPLKKPGETPAQRVFSPAKSRATDGPCPTTTP